MGALRPIKLPIPTCLRHNPKQLHPTTFRIPLALSCAARSDSTAAVPVQDEAGPPLLKSADWRAFRAKLVATERAEAAPPKQAAALPLPAEEEDKWAHAIPEPEKGCVLIATEKLDGSHVYKRTVILVLSTGSDGVRGVILNRPSFMSTKEMKPWASNTPPALSETPLFFGGPLFEGLFLVNTSGGGGGGEEEEKVSGVFDQVLKGVSYGSAESLGEVQWRGRGGDFIFRFFDGYCFWGSEQLRDEIRAGHWAVAACSPNVVGPNGVALWEEVNGLVGRRKVC